VGGSVHHNLSDFSKLKTLIRIASRIELEFLIQYVPQLACMKIGNFTVS